MERVIETFILIDLSMMPKKKYTYAQQAKSFISPGTELAKIEDFLDTNIEIMKPVVPANIKSTALKAKKDAVSAVMSIRIF